MPPNATTAFLKCVLPDEGYYCAVVFDSPNPRPGVDFPRQHFCGSVEELAELLLFHDGRGRTVYHACATFRDPQAVKPRSHANVRAARALWLDIDAGPGKPYADADVAYRAVASCVHSAGLPDPVYVGSGNGLHAYWPLEEELDHHTWQQYAMGLKLLCTEKGLAADPARTADISSILRTPGTHHRKNGERLVVTDETTFRRHPIGVFARILGDVATVTRNSYHVVEAEDGSVIGRIFESTSYGAVYADAIADQCAQLGAFRQSGNLPEPTWYAALGVLSRCADGLERAHEWSARNYPGYRADETQFKFDRTKQLTGATTCAKLDSVNPGVCPQCPFFGAIGSPVSIPVLNEAPPAAVSIAAPDALPMLPVPPSPFAWGSEGQLCCGSENADGDKSYFVVTENPVYLESVQTSELDRTSFSYTFKYYLPQEGWCEVQIDAKELYGASGIASMAGKGVVIHDAKMFLNYARLSVDDYHDEEHLQTRFDQFGWKNGNTSFLFGKYLYTSAGPVEALGAKEVATRCQWLGPRKNGNLNAWTEAADGLFASEMEAVSAAVLAGFAAPLMKFQAENEGGAIMHLFTPESGMGKSTALMGAWSIWGQKEGLNLTNDDTRVSKPIAIGALANLPVFYDELRNKDPEVIRQFVVMFTEGRDRMRGAVDGTIRHTKANWQTILLSAANNSLLDQLTTDGVDAPAFRVLELSVNLSKDADKSKGDRLKRVLDANCGCAGDLYLRYLTQPDVLAWTRQALDQWTGELWARTRLDQAHRFRVRLVGAIAVASMLVNKLDILHFQSERIVEWLINEITSVKHKGTVSAVPTIDRAIAALGDFMNEHYGETVVVPDKYRPKTPKMIPLLKPHHRLSIRFEVIPQRVFISLNVFRKWALLHQMSPQSVLTLLKEHGVLLDTGRQITLSAGTDIPGAQTMCIEANTAHPAMSGLVASVADLAGNVVNSGSLPHRAGEA